MQNLDFIARGERVRQTAAQTRAEVLRSRINFSLTLCWLAENHMRWGQDARGLAIVEKIRRSTDQIRAHLNDPDHVPDYDLADLFERLARLERRVRRVRVQPKQAF